MSAEQFFRHRTDVDDAKPYLLFMFVFIKKVSVIARRNADR